jgi:hypothetical protein
VTRATSIEDLPPDNDDDEGEDCDGDYEIPVMVMARCAVDAVFCVCAGGSDGGLVLEDHVVIARVHVDGGGGRGGGVGCVCGGGGGGHNLSNVSVVEVNDDAINGA